MKKAIYKLTNQNTIINQSDGYCEIILDGEYVFGTKQLQGNNIMLNRGEILIKVMQILDFDMSSIRLKQSIEKKRFVTLEESPIKFKEHLTLIAKELKLDEANFKLVEIFTELFNLYEIIEKQLLYRLDKSYEKKINWIILKRLVVPYLAYRFANLDSEYNNRIDKNMSGGLFWYLPDLVDCNDIKMPIQTLMKWWLDLYERGLDSLCNEIDEQSNENQAFESINTLKPWLYKNKLPKRATIELYLSQNINYRGVFKREVTNNVTIEFERCKDFVKTKGLTAETLNHEISEKTLINKFFKDTESLSERQKEKFIQLISERWSEPSKESLISKFIIVRAVQDLYGRLVEYFDIEKDSMRIEDNKVLQLFYQYGVLYNIEISKKMDYDLSAYKMIDYEYLQPFYSNNSEVIQTIFSDINIEIKHSLVGKDRLDEAYLIMYYYAGLTKNKELEKKFFKKYQLFNKYFHKDYYNIENEMNKYRTLNSKDFSLKLQSENNFELLSYLFSFYIKDYTRAEKICFQISKVAKSREEKLEALGFLLGRYTDFGIDENKNEYITTKDFLEQYLELLSEEEINNENKLISLQFQINFYLKLKKFKESLVFCDEYFSKFIVKQKKEELHSVIVYISAYCAYTCKDKQKLKKYNKFLKKYHFKEFETQQSLPFTIYFYK